MGVLSFRVFSFFKFSIGFFLHEDRRTFSLINIEMKYCATRTFYYDSLNGRVYRAVLNLNFIYLSVVVMLLLL